MRGGVGMGEGGEVSDLAKARLKATVLLRAFWLGDDQSLRVKENPNCTSLFSRLSLYVCV